MLHKHTRALMLLLLLVSCSRSPAQLSLAAQTSLPAVTIVIYNSSVPESVELAQFYAQKRGIAKDHLVGLRCSREEEISREEYDKTIRDPLRDVFRKRRWWSTAGDGENTRVLTNAIYFAALIKGVPMKIRAAEAYPGDKPGPAPLGNRNEASVDSELMVLARHGPEVSGALNNPYYKSYRAIAEFTEAPLLLVSRLDAPSAATVRRMITDAIEVEKSGLWGRAYVDGANNTSGGLALGDSWLSEIPPQLRKVGVPTVFDNDPPTFPIGYPMSDCALYYGWYSPALTGPFVDPAFRFTRGAVAVHLYSFSASTMRDPNASWVATLLERGAAGTLGNVYEPYLQLTANLNLFNDRLVHGFTLAESAYMATPAASWMNVVIGDPLYRPYAAWLQLETKKPPAAAAISDWKMYHEFAVQNASADPVEYRKLARQAASRARNGPMIEDLGAMEAEQGNWAAATGTFQQARSLYTKRDDILRTTLFETNAWAKQGKPERGLTAVRNVLRIVSDPATVALFKKVEADLSPPAPPLGAPVINPSPRP